MSTTANLPENGSVGWLVRPFAPISLDALNAKAAMLERLDNKYVVRALVLNKALGDLTQLFDVLEIDGERAFTYDTCYFDDAERRSYFDHHQGRRQRMKVRVRRYVDAGLCFVEVKLKDKRGITVKKRMPYTVEKFGTLDDAAVKHVEKCYSSLYGKPFDRELEPVLSMRYRRITLVAREGGERMTIDSQIRFFGGDDEHGTDEDVFIVETKSSHGNGVADSILRKFHQHPTNGCSKYCVGMSVTGAVDRFNKFMPALRKLGALEQLSMGAA
jgi:VTC domain